MDNKELIDKLENIEKLIQEERDKVHSAVKISAIFYGILVLIVIGYSITISVQIKSMATPNTIATLATDMLETRIPEMNQFIRENAKSQSPIWANKAVNVIYDLMPQLEIMAKKQIDKLVDNLITETQDRYFPKLVEFCHENLDKVFKDADLADESMAKSLADVLVDEINRELKKIINTKFYYKIREVREEVDKIVKKPKNQLTKRENAERQVLIYWTFLVNHGEIGKSKIHDSIKFMSFFMKAFDDVHIDLEKHKSETY